MYDKEKTTLIMFHNIASSRSTFQIDFNSSENIMIRADNVKGSLVTIRLEGEERQIIEVLPKNLRKPMVLNSFDISRLENMG